MMARQLLVNETWCYGESKVQTSLQLELLYRIVNYNCHDYPVSLVEVNFGGEKIVASK